MVVLPTSWRPPSSGTADGVKRELRGQRPAEDVPNGSTRSSATQTGAISPKRDTTRTRGCGFRSASPWRTGLGSFLCAPSLGAPMSASIIAPVIPPRQRPGPSASGRPAVVRRMPLADHHRQRGRRGRPLRPARHGDPARPRLPSAPLLTPPSLRAAPRRHGAPGRAPWPGHARRLPDGSRRPRAARRQDAGRATRRVSLPEPIARPIARGRLASPSSSGTTPGSSATTMG